MATSASISPRIGIPIRLSGLGCGVSDPVLKEAERAFDAVVSLILGSGAEAVLISPAGDLELEETFASCHGFVLPGGGDVNPALFGGSAEDPSLFGVDATQDSLDLAAIQYGIDHGIPVLGICRGMQLLNVAYGGSLHIDLGPSSVSHVSKGEEGSRDFSVHEVELKRGSRVAVAFDGESRIPVASFHHQAVDLLGDGLRPTAVADDGLLEAIESVDDNWIVGIQWHPEADLPAPTLRQPLFAALKAEAEKMLLRIS
ncbi:gamma-glutamyl-gamma-aminobutyrate hydrolase family protein [Paenarthrobacter nicotinovorans]|uniref:gamma-glutamyl-gamma-aminobutyrate hydrolase family protein n=1 Tax=Paenarthrobacter nicotinovorans TaxID=29320 RepID=UPI0016658642|nr:gamma-glutamyl-gamma-aminobutyrate hydrolase family protein [Paenarthrobacter nicotinovorans]MBP2392801.1 putative glutamine amidotransferase [Paenarthrobacter nicotinovorans]UKF00901.1 gamma-glutamyl-gamma-aminobutyrate hydrolase family protein [Paenarthrobacter nicotinovorans]UKF05684.1 gamma-glutamyl-gamma-aminobutyrate hydrolase family protein [Paenarthrobacter nicotinovorans]GGV28354.1 hypothetical protein GCM10010212_13520 [Paenarthrobacter nicotinovorans]